MATAPTIFEPPHLEAPQGEHAEFVIIEEARNLATVLQKHRPRADRSHVLAHGEGESVCSFAERVRRRVASMSGRCPIMKLCYVVASNSTPHEVERRRLLESLLAALEPGGSFTLVASATSYGVCSWLEVLFPLAKAGVVLNVTN